MAEKFVPRHISRDQAEQGYNNEGRGKLLGYLAVPHEHETTCFYRISTGGDPNTEPHELCTCRLGLWQEEMPSVGSLKEMRKMAFRTKKPAKPKAKSIKRRHK